MGKNKSGHHSDNSDCTSTHNTRRSCNSNESYTYTTDCRRSDKSDCTDDCRDTTKDCSDDCGLKHSTTPVGVWNLIFEYEPVTSSTSSNTASTTTSTTLIRPTQLLVNVGGTFSNTSTPDLKNNPIMELLSTGVGVWRETGERKLKLVGTNIAYKASDGSPVSYYKFEILMKLNRSGTKALFCGHAVPKDLSDPKLCTDLTNGITAYFSGRGYKVLQPHH